MKRLRPQGQKGMELKMNISDIKQVAGSVFKKYKYIAIVIFAGIVLLLLPGKKNETPAAQTGQTEVTQSGTILPLTETEQKLERLLCDAAGVGRVKVILSARNSGQANYAKDTRKSENDTQEQIKTVSGDSGESPLLIDYKAPVFLGAVILCDGADDPKVRLAISDALGAFCGISASKITIIKMKP